MRAPELYVLSPVIDNVAAFAPALERALAGGGVAAVLLRLAAVDERGLTNGVKALAPVAQDAGAAVVIASEGSANLPTIAARGGADGVHVSGEIGGLHDLRRELKEGRILGAGGLRSRDDAMAAGEAGADYLLFGEPRPDGTTPSLEAVAERAAWWAEIFETPCVAYAPTLEAIAVLAATGAEFIGVGDAVWLHRDGPEAAVTAARAALSRSEAAH